MITVEIGVYGMVNHKYDAIDSAIVEYEFIIIILMINGCPEKAQATATNINITKERSKVMQLSISLCNKNQNNDASVDLNSVLDFKLYDTVVGIFLVYA